MNISVCITVFNEEKTISALLESLLVQSKKPDQIIIVDGGSGDKTVEIIRHYQRKDGRIKLFVEKCSRARGRNLGVEIAKDGVIAMTDAGCVPDINWLRNITKPFETKRIQVVAGFYKMTGNSPFQKAVSVFLGVTPRRFDSSFLPSTRSIAFTKKTWVDVGGFPESSEGTAEDTVFNYKLVKSSAKISRVKDATVEWGMPETLGGFKNKIFEYAKGDSKSGIKFFPGKGIMSHNIKAISIFLRYFIFGLALILSFVEPPLFILFVTIIVIYYGWSYRKVYLEYSDWKASKWGPVLQFSSDVSVMRGFISGIIA